MFRSFIEKIDNSFLKLSNPHTTHTNIKNIVGSYKPFVLNEIIEEYIDDNFDQIEKIIETNKNKSCYKFILHKSENYDIIHIKWEKGFQSDKHQHSKFNNIIYVINDGCLVEHIFKYWNIFNMFVRSNIVKLKYGELNYKLDNNEIHKIVAKQYTETLHINVHDPKSLGICMRLFKKYSTKIIV